MRKTPGFTLAEVLIALALLGVVAAFTIPKVLEVQGNAKNKALLLETLAATQSIIYSGNLGDEMSSSLTLTDYMAQKLNATQVCKVNFQTEGCYSLIAPANAQNGGGFVLPSGVVIMDVHLFPMSTCNNPPGVNTCPDGWFIDLNGINPPNTFGQDMIAVELVWGGKGGVVVSGGPPMKLGEFRPDATNAPSVAMWKALFE